MFLKQISDRFNQIELYRIQDIKILIFPDPIIFKQILITVKMLNENLNPYTCLTLLELSIF